MTVINISCELKIKKGNKNPLNELLFASHRMIPQADHIKTSPHVLADARV